MTRRANLLVICQDFPIMLKTTIRPKRSRRSYHYDRQVKVGTENIRVNLENVKEKIKELQEKYPDKKFYFERHTVTVLNAPENPSLAFTLARHIARTMVCWIIGRREKGKKNIPVYWSSRFEKLYVPKSYYERNKRLTCSVISYRLRDLGIPFRLAYA